MRDGGGGWRSRPGGLPEALLAEALVADPAPEAELSLPGVAWAAAYALRPGGGAGPVMVVSAALPPRPSRALRLRLIALRVRARSARHAAATLRDEATRLVGGVRSLVADGDALESLRSAQRRVIDALGAGTGSAGVAQALARAAGRPVAVWDGGGLRVLAAGPGGAAVDARVPALPDPLVERRPFRSGDWLCCAVRAPGGRLAIVGIFDHDGLVGSVGALMLEDTAAISAVELPRSPLARAREEGAELADALVHDADPARARLLAVALGHDLDRTHQVVIVQGDPGAPLAVAVARAAQAQDAAALATVHPGGAALVVTSPVDWPAFEAAVESGLGHPAFTVATSGWGPAGEGLDGARRQAETALRLGAATGGPRVVHFDDLGMLRLLAAGDRAGLGRFVQQWLGALVDYDARRHAELVRTLAAYLDRGGSVERAAEALFVHPSTLKYRLARVGELTGFDLGDPDTRFQLQLALRSRAILESMGAAGG